jgi:hypothetical protein
MESIRDRAVTRLGEHAVGLHQGIPIVTFKATKGSDAFDLDSFKRDYPGLFSKYAYTKPAGRRFVPVGP